MKQIKRKKLNNNEISKSLNNNNINDKKYKTKRINNDEYYKKIFYGKKIFTIKIY